MERIEKQLHQEKGFTLVEIIVVLVILAILAAFTIPTMLGFVEEAKAKAYIAEAREVYVAAQAVATEMIGTGRSDLDTASTNNPYDALNSYRLARSNSDPTSTDYNAACEQMKKYIGTDLIYTKKSYSDNYLEGESYWYVMVGGSKKYKDKPLGTVQEVYYVKNGYIVWYSEGKITVEKLKPTGRPKPPWQ